MHAVRIAAPWRVSKVQVLPNFRLEVTFMDGLKGYIDMSRYITQPKAGVFAQLKSKTLFNKVHLKYGVVTWPGNIDLAPDAMHDHIQKNGEWVL